MIGIAVEYLRVKFPVNRVVALATAPAAVLAGNVAAWLTDHLPFIADQVDKGELTAIFLGTVAAVVSVAYKWLDGWQKHESLVAGVDPFGPELDA